LDQTLSDNPQSNEFTCLEQSHNCADLSLTFSLCEIPHESRRIEEAAFGNGRHLSLMDFLLIKYFIHFSIFRQLIGQNCERWKVKNVAGIIG
jgi:hypothetical protein